MPRKARRRGKTQKPDEQHTDSDTMEENQPPQQESEETETAQPIEKKKLIKVLLEEDKEEEVLEWIKANPTLYDKSLKGYKNKSEKDAKWCIKAEEIGISGECYTV